jgi:hypothetical protein
MAVSVDAGVQCAPGVLMVRPARFGYNSQTAASNRFQRAESQSVDTAARARSEFETLVAGIQTAGVSVCVVDDSVEPPKPDAVFPNNWVSFHGDGTVVLYPMQAPNRREERRIEVLQAVEARLHFRRSRLVDLRAHEEQGTCSKAPAAWCSITCTGWPTPAVPHAPMSRWFVNGRS